MKNAMKKRNWFWMTLIIGVCSLCWLQVNTTVQAEEGTAAIRNGEQASAAEGDDTVAGEYFQTGDSGQLVMEGVSSSEGTGTIQYEYSSTDTSVVIVDVTGHYQFVGGGSAVVTVTGTDEKGENVFRGERRFYCCGDASGATLAQTSLKTYIVYGNTKEVTVAFNNLPDLTYSIFDYTSSNESMDVSCVLDKEKKQLTISSASVGKTMLTITLNNQTFNLTVTTSEVTINKDSSLLAKKKSTTLKLKGYSGKVTWKSTKKKVVSVNSKGVIKGKKVGNSVVYASFDGYKVGCAVSVVTAKRKTVINTAKKIAKGTYSQPKRMSKGYYDCSSLVWRAYKKEGIYFGDKSYAPVAATMCKWCISKKKRIKGGLSNSNIQNMKLRAGDLMFRSGASNGRYKGVYHVEMFVGYQCEGFDSKGKPILGTLWASKPANYYFGDTYMGRP